MNRFMWLILFFLIAHLASCSGDGGGGSSGPGPVPCSARLIDVGDGTVIDTLTGLMWLQDANKYGQKNWELALYNATNPFITYTDWHLPNVRELLSLIDYSQKNPALLCNNPFLNISKATGGVFWSSTTYYSNFSMAWGVDINTGEKKGIIKTETSYNQIYVRIADNNKFINTVLKTGQYTFFDQSYQESNRNNCLSKSGPYCNGQDGVKLYGKDMNPVSRYIDLGYGIKDTFNSIVWLKQPVKSTYTWELASEYCMEDIAGYTDWRMPTVYELESLLDASVVNPALPAGNKFKDILNSNYWSSTLQAGTSLKAWCVNMGNGAITPLAKTASYNIWPVRDILGE